MTSTRPAWFGVSMQPAGVGGGVLATQIVPGSPAERAGVRVSDRIKKVAGAEVSSPLDVQRAVGAHAPGDVIAVIVERESKELTVKVELAARPSPDAMARATYVGKQAPNLVGLISVGGPAITTEGLKNRVVVVDFWAVWCVPCRLSMPALSAMQARYGAQGLTVLSITTDPVERAATFARDLALRTTVAVDKEGETTRLYGVSVLPTSFVLDRRGVVREVLLGYDRAQEAKLEAVVRELLAEPAPPATPVAPVSSGAPAAVAPAAVAPAAPDGGAPRARIADGGR